MEEQRAVFPCLLAVPPFALSQVWLALLSAHSGGVCNYHVLRQEHRLAVDFMLLKGPACHLNCCLNLEHCKILASYK